MKNRSIYFDVSDEEKELIELAAKCNKQSMLSYVFSVVMKQAMLDVEKNESIVLNNKQRDLVLELLDNPPKANNSLKELIHQS